MYLCSVRLTPCYLNKGILLRYELISTDFELDILVKTVKRAVAIRFGEHSELHKLYCLATNLLIVRPIPQRQLTTLRWLNRRHSWHSRHHNETSMLHRSNSGMVQIAMTSTESGKNRTDLVRVKGQSKEDGRSWLELVHRSWCYKAAVSVVRDLGVFLDSELSMCHHINTVVRNWFFHLRRLKSVRRIIGAEVISGLVSAFVITRLDY